MDLGGLIGAIQLNSSELTDSQWQHLLMAEKVNIGKHTVFGMGKIEVNSLSSKIVWICAALQKFKYNKFVKPIIFFEKP